MTIGGLPCPLLSQTSDHTRIVCTIPAGTSTGKAVLVNVGSQLSNSLSFSYNPPALMAISPGNGQTIGGTPLTLSGYSFGTTGTASVTVGGRACTVTSQTHKRIVCTLPEGEGLNQLVRVVVGTLTSSATPVFFNYNKPNITSVSPANGATGGGITVTVKV